MFFFFQTRFAKIVSETIAVRLRHVGTRKQISLRRSIKFRPKPYVDSLNPEQHARTKKKLG